MCTLSLFFLSLYFLLSHLTPCECTISWSSLVLDVMTSDGLGRGWVSRLCPLPSPSIQSDTTSPPPLAPSLPPPHSSHPSPYFLPLHLIKLTMWCYLHADFADPHPTFPPPPPPQPAPSLFLPSPYASVSLVRSSIL